MIVKQATFSARPIAADELKRLAEPSPNLILVFAAPAWFGDASLGDQLAMAFPDAIVLGCSTAGEISGNGVHAGHCIVTAARFERSSLNVASTDLADMADSTAAGRRLAEQLRRDDLRAVLVFGQGVGINGSGLIEGMRSVLGADVVITGGLAGDEGAFTRTWTIGPAGVSDRAVVGLGLGGPHLRFSHGSFGGWEPFGPPRKATRCEGNVLHELDGEPALTVYKRYLGDYAKDLPAAGLLFPFSRLTEERKSTGLIRTILGIDETEGSLVLAGDIQADGYLQLMHASTDTLVRGAEAAAQAAGQMDSRAAAGLAILVSCVGRKLAMGARVDEEVEAVANVLGRKATLTGFYSNGEISPMFPGGDCKLHNQTMTITCLAED